MDFSKIITANNSVFNKMCQIGIVVRDIDKTLAIYKAAFGWEPFGFSDTPPGEKYYYGKAEDFSVKMAFIRFENIEIELLQPVRGKNVWQDFLDEHGEGMHHILFDVNNFSEAQKYLECQGIQLVQQGPSARYKGAKWAYFNAMDQLGYYIECYNPSELGYKTI